MSSSLRLVIATFAIVAAANACAPAAIQTDPDTPDGAATASPSDSSEEVSPTPSPSPTKLPEALAEGANHNNDAVEYAYKAADVETWSQEEAEDSTAPGKLVFLTFDDGPNHVVTPQILDSLAEAGVPATFFLIGSNIGDAPEMLERQIAEGHAIGMHSWSHDYGALYPGRSANPDKIVEEHNRTLEAIQEVVGEEFRTTAWRYPGGHMSWSDIEAADKALEDLGTAWVDWNGMTGDAEPSASRPSTVGEMVGMASSPIARETPVVVILAHDTPDKDLTAQALPEIIERYQDAGYEFGVIS